MSFPRPSFFLPTACTVTLLCLWLQPSQAQEMNYHSPLHARAMLHEDGTRSDSVKSIPKREMIDSTFDARGVLITKKRFLLNERGDAIQGVIYDGANNLVANVQFYFDNLGRVIEERCINTQGQIFRRVIRQYDANGKALEPKAFNYAVNMPKVKAPTMDFTKGGQAPHPNSNAQGIQAAPPVAVAPKTTPHAAASNAATVKPAPAAAAEKKKRRWFGKKD